jgi:hypothetical protein
VVQGVIKSATLDEGSSSSRREVQVGFAVAGVPQELENKKHVVSEQGWAVEEMRRGRICGAAPSFSRNLGSCGPQQLSDPGSVTRVLHETGP